jgi:hypothetical protein
MENDIETDWNNFCENDGVALPEVENIRAITDNTRPCTSLKISTKTMISYLNCPIDLKDIFWKIPLIRYHEPTTGVIKKQMKFNSLTAEEVNEINTHKAVYEANKEHVDEYIISQINNPDGRIKFKDIRKLSFGICRKDMTSYRSKKKSAFYNCFVVFLRIFQNNTFKEIHVKVFNTGKLEIPGIKDDLTLHIVLTLLVKIIGSIVNVIVPVPSVLVPLSFAEPLSFVKEKTETVMINSNFSCGYYINREKLYKLLKYKYKINSNFDPCSYPGIQCEFYYDTVLDIQTGVQPAFADRSDQDQAHNVVKVSFMIFRTGSVLIVGKCSEEILQKIYAFLCQIFTEEFNEIKCINILANTVKPKEPVTKIRRKTIMVY